MLVQLRSGVVIGIIDTSPFCTSYSEKIDIRTEKNGSSYLEVVFLVASHF